MVTECFKCFYLFIFFLQAVFPIVDKVQRKSRTKAFDTIKEEESGIHQKQHKSAMLSKAVQVSRGYNHTLQKIKPLHRTSSASSTESIISIGRSTRLRPSTETTPRSSTEKLNKERNSQQPGSGKSNRRRHHQSDNVASYTGGGSASSKHRDILSSRENSTEDIRQASHQRLRRSTAGKDKSAIEEKRYIQFFCFSSFCFPLILIIV